MLILFQSVIPAIRQRQKKREKTWVTAAELPEPTFGPAKSGKMRIVKPTEEHLEKRRQLASIPSKNDHTVVKKLMVYPIKSCRGIEAYSVIAAKVGLEIHTEFGVIRDRQVLLVYYHKYLLIVIKIFQVIMNIRTRDAKFVLHQVARFR